MSRRHSPARSSAFLVIFLSAAPVLADDATREQAVTILKDYQRTLDARPTRFSIDVEVLARVESSAGHAGACGYRTRCLLHPSFEAAAFTHQLQEGATLANQSDLSRPYRWKDGAPVPKSNDRQ